MASSWDKKIQKAEKFFEKAKAHGQAVYTRYRDNRDEETMPGKLKKINFFYGNVNTLKESLFNSLPKPDVSRLHKGDFVDDASRVAALIVQRGLTYEISQAKDFTGSIRSAILDRLVPGIGQIWIGFEVDTQVVGQDEEGNDIEAPLPGTERITIDRVFWEDFIYEPVRSWDKVGWCGRILELDKSEMISRWGEEAVEKIEKKPAKNSKTPKEILEDKYRVYEIWDKRKKEVIYHVIGSDEPLEVKPDPYKLKDFFPCPPPLIANPTTAAYLPVTDYHIAQDQYVELDVLYARIALIVKAIKVAGVYDASCNEISRMLEGEENKLIPVENWAMYAEKGGAKGVIDYYPVEQVASVLQLLQAQFEATKGLLFEITGMSDIIRGDSSPYETKGAQEIKAQFASVRMNGYQRDIAEFVTVTLQIITEMMTQLYSDDKMRAIVGRLSEADEVFVPQAAKILRDDFISSYKISIRADSLTQADWALEKGQRMELMGYISTFMQSAVPAIEQTPELGELLLSLMKWTITGFRGSSEVEGIIDQQLDAIVKAKSQPQPPPPPSPEEIQAKMDQEKMQMEFQMSQQEAEHRMRLEMMQAEADIATETRKMEMEQEIKMMEMDMAREKHQMEMQMLAAKLDAEKVSAQIKLTSQAASASMGGEDA